MRRLLVNDALNQLGEHTFWNDLVEWFDMEFVGGDYTTLAGTASQIASEVCNQPASRPRASLIIRNATWFPPIRADIPTISLLQDIMPDGEMRNMQDAVISSSRAVVFNSLFTASKYSSPAEIYTCVIPLPVDFSLFTPQNAMGCQQALSLPDGCVLWIGASQGAAGQVKGFDIFQQIVRTNPDIPFVGVFKDAAPESIAPNLRCYTRLSHADLVKVIGACRVGLCTSRAESQHLAGIEMGACGLPIVAPSIGIYWRRDDIMKPSNIGVAIAEPTVQIYSEHLRNFLRANGVPQPVREYWRKEFDKPVIKAAWTKLIEEVENEKH